MAGRGSTALRIGSEPDTLSTCYGNEVPRNAFIVDGLRTLDRLWTTSDVSASAENRWENAIQLVAKSGWGGPSENSCVDLAVVFWYCARARSEHTQ